MKAKKLIPALLVAAGVAVGYGIFKVAKEKIELEKRREEDLENEVIYQKIYKKIEESDDTENNTDDSNEEVESWDESDATKEESDQEAKYEHLNAEVLDAINEYSDETIAELAQAGDPGTTERPIQHYVSFKDEASMDQFKAKVQDAGFVITNGDSPMELVVLHISNIDRAKLLTNILFIADAAYANMGTYHGWASRITK
ncbi:MAG: ribonuclease E inhibitor RraB [Erysipelotrichaceae bacterium]